jgi:HTH-type transcriptional regulator, glycine betaine synthesis regulator
MAIVTVGKTEEVLKNTGASSRLESAEVEIINLFVQFARAFGQPRSVAEIYGLIFASHLPLPMDAFIERLNLSKGSASQGLKILQDLGAVRTVYVPGDRRTHYEATTELRKLAANFLNKQILTHFEDSEMRLNRIEAESKNLSSEQMNHILERTRLLRRWQETGRQLMPFVLKMLGGD